MDRPNVEVIAGNHCVMACECFAFLLKEIIKHTVSEYEFPSENVGGGRRKDGDSVMSRSYKRNPVYKPSSDKRDKRAANKRVRMSKLLLVGKGADYKKIFESWDIRDYRTWEGLNNHLEDWPSHDDLLGHEHGRFSTEPQGVYIENNSREGAVQKPDELAGIIFISNNGYHCRGINPTLDVEYVGLPKETRRNKSEEREERITTMVAYLEKAWRKNSDKCFSEFIRQLVSDKKIEDFTDIEFIELLKNM